MKINFPNVIIILIASIVVALLINFLRPDGLSLSRKPKPLVWIDSSQLNNKINKDSISFDKENASKNKGNQKENIELVSDTSENLFNEPIAINLEQAYILYRNNIIFLDAREHVDYTQGHIKNALNLPYYDFENYKQILKNIPKRSTIVTYCAGSDCDLSVLLGKQLYDEGYKRVYIFFGGWNDWLTAKYPIEKTSNL